MTFYLASFLCAFFALPARNLFFCYESQAALKESWETVKTKKK